MVFPENVAVKALLDCGRCCCICHKFCGIKIELHHIIQKAEGGEDSYENCIPLCLDCHAEIKAYNPKHPKGRKYTESEVRGHRDRWYKKLQDNHVTILNPGCIELDKKLFLKIKKILQDPDGSICFIRDHLYIEPFPRKRHYDLIEHMHQDKNPEYEFIDSDLEICRCTLNARIDDFINTLFEVSFILDGERDEPEMMAIYPEIKYTNPGLYYESVENVSQARDRLCAASDNLIRLGRRKLAVE